jgi:hypothetical protein
MLAFKNALLRVFAVRVSLLILVDERKQIDWSNLHENDLSILDLLFFFVLLDNATFSRLQGIKVVLSSNLDLSFPQSLEGYQAVIIQPMWEFEMVDISAVRQSSHFVEILAPNFGLILAVAVIELALLFAEHFDAREALAGRQQHSIENLRVRLVKKVIDRRVVEHSWHIILH